MHRLPHLIFFILSFRVPGIRAVPTQLNQIIYVRGAQHGNETEDYWAINGSGKPQGTTYDSVITYWDSLYDNIEGTLKKRDDNYVLVDTCYENYCQLVTLQFINGTVKNYQIETQNVNTNVTGNTFSQHMKRDEVQYNSRCDRKICGLNVKSLAKFYNTAASVFDFSNNAYSVVSSIIDRIVNTFKSDKKRCEGFELDNIILDPLVSWNAYVSTYTTGKNCDTTATADQLKCALKTALESEHNHQKTAFCIHIDHGGSFNMDVRFVATLSGTHNAPWSLPCSEVGDDWTWTSDCW
ncbi:similar to Kazachstania africana KAFR_0K00140 hypothetical protein [Maudiozyma saulgeensis]|uniref:Secreted protein CSS2 C-terminal domain-containing protein n=1 Tax=Maudiozyma saulgeensis TaxID=1789683 RepID=A0A1X7R6R2_9SACH|nr:similar to Kazachstania africana KAFR_0K00140 hypothetical protein [Kazachstania saulgeensis]